MTGAATALLVACAVLAAADWAATGDGRRPVRYVTKPAALVALVGVASALDPVEPTARAWFVAALAFSLAGDVFLVLPSSRFVEGLGAFLVAHLAYAGGLVAAGVSGALLLVGLVVVGVAVAVISAMVVCAVGTGDGVAIAGAVLFYASDALEQVPTGGC